MSESGAIRSEERSQELTPLVGTPLDLLTNHRRRAILRILLGQDDARIEFTDLATELISRDTGDHSSDLETATIHLRHADLPKLADAGLVEHNRESGMVQYQGNEEIEDFLECVREKTE